MKFNRNNQQLTTGAPHLTLCAMQHEVLHAPRYAALPERIETYNIRASR